MKTYFRWSNIVILITAVCTIVLIAAFCKIVLSDAGIYLKFGLGSIIIFVLFYCLFMLPISMEVDLENLKINKIFSSILIPIHKIEDMTEIPPKFVRCSIRLFGSGGLCGYLGIFYNKKLGKYTMYATELENLILIITPSKKYVISCPDVANLTMKIKDYKK